MLSVIFGCWKPKGIRNLGIHESHRAGSCLDYKRWYSWISGYLFGAWPDKRLNYHNNFLMWKGYDAATDQSNNVWALWSHASSRSVSSWPFGGRQLNNKSSSVVITPPDNIFYTISFNWSHLWSSIYMICGGSGHLGQVIVAIISGWGFVERQIKNELGVGWHEMHGCCCQDDAFGTDKAMPPLQLTTIFYWT